MCTLCISYKGYLLNKHIGTHHFVLKTEHYQCFWNSMWAFPPPQSWGDHWPEFAVNYPRFPLCFYIYQCIPNNKLFSFASYLYADWIILYVSCHDFHSFMSLFDSTWDSSMLVHMVVVHSFLLRYSISLHEWTTIHLSIQVLMDFALVPDFAVRNNATVIILSMFPEAFMWVL